MNEPLMDVLKECRDATGAGNTDPVAPKLQRVQLRDVLKGSRDGTGAGIGHPVAP